MNSILAASKTIKARAPGKLILAGEYAVLFGWPALVCAMDRYFEAELRALPKSDALGENAAPFLELETLGLESATECFSFDEYGRLSEPSSDRLRLFQQVFNALLDYHDNGQFSSSYWHLTLDSRALFDRGDKLGLGSSAAMVVALDRLLAMLYSGASARSTNKVIESDSEHWCRLHEVHSAAQGKQGSGVDIAASLFGGVIGFRNHQHERCDLFRFAWPQALHIAYIWSGKSASTASYIGSLTSWRRQNEGEFLSFMSQLGRSAERIVSVFSKRTERDLLVDKEGSQSTQAADGLRSQLALFTATLYEFDNVSKLGIFAAGHAQAYLASRDSSLVIYKPCGAGGGDLGVALSSDSNALRQTISELEVMGMRPVSMQISPP